MTLPENVIVGQTGHANLHNQVNAAVNKINLHATYTAPQLPVGYWQSLDLNFATLAASTDPEPIMVQTNRAGTMRRSFWLNENGSPRAASVASEPGLKVFGPAGDTSYTGMVIQILNRWNGAGSQVHLFGIDNNGRPVIGTGMNLGSHVIVLNSTDPVPTGLPINTVIVRTTP